MDKSSEHLTIYLERIRSFLTSHDDSIIFPSVTMSIEDILVNIAKDTNFLKQSRLDDCKSVAEKLTTVLDENKDVFTLDYEFKFDDKRKKVMVYKKIPVRTSEIPVFTSKVPVHAFQEPVRVPSKPFWKSKVDEHCLTNQSALTRCARYASSFFAPTTATRIIGHLLLVARNIAFQKGLPSGYHVMLDEDHRRGRLNSLHVFQRALHHMLWPVGPGSRL